MSHCSCLFLCMVVNEMDNLRGLVGIRRLDKVRNARITELYGVTKDVDERMVQSCGENGE